MTETIQQANSSIVRVGLISDTHGLLRDEALRLLQDSDLIIHAGDVGDAEVLTKLERLAPLTTVRGNVDREPWTSRLPLSAVVEAGGLAIYVLHDIADLDLNPKNAGFGVVVYGHSHVPSEEMRKGVLFINPGSAGPRRFRLPISLALLEIEGTSIRRRFVNLVSGETFKPGETSSPTRVS
jgi:putative phosphoesterase